MICAQRGISLIDVMPIRTTTYSGVIIVIIITINVILLQLQIAANLNAIVFSKTLQQAKYRGDVVVKGGGKGKLEV